MAVAWVMVVTVEPSGLVRVTLLITVVESFSVESLAVESLDRVAALLLYRNTRDRCQEAGSTTILPTMPMSS